MKYKLTDNKKKVDSKVLYQIEALIDFASVSKGDLGGWIEREGNLFQVGDAWVSGDARVFGDAQISGNAHVSGNARVSGDARIFGDARISGDARVFGNAHLSARASFTKGRFIGGDNSGKITDITDKTGSLYLKNQYVLGDCEITNSEEEEGVEEVDAETILLNGKTYKLIK